VPLLDLLRPVSGEELRALSERNPGWPFERLADGRLVVSPAGGERGRISAAVLGQLYRGNEAWGLGVVFGASTGCKLPDGLVLAPDAVFEVRSRGQSLEELRGKAAWYLKNGVRLVVLLDPYAHRVEGHQGPERVPLDPELPGFALETRSLFLP